MRRLKNWIRANIKFIGGYSLGVLSVAGCASLYPYPYYATQIPNECYDKGKLLGVAGKNGWPDIDFSECKPSDTVKLKCITLRSNSFYSLKADNEKCHSDLSACQNGPPPN